MTTLPTSLLNEPRSTHIEHHAALHEFYNTWAGITPPDTVNVKDYGAVGDGVTDDTVAIQASINSVSYGIGVPAISIVLPPGTYKITDTIDIDRRAVILRGSGVGNPTNYTVNPGRGTAIKWAGSSSLPMFKINDSQHIVIEDMLFSGSTTNRPTEALYFENTGGDIGTNQYISVSRCRFGYLAWELDGYAMDYCVRFGGTNGNNDQFYFHDCAFIHPTVACFQLDNSQSVWGALYNCTFDGNERAAKGLVTSANVALYNAAFNSCSIDIDINISAQVDIYGHYSEGSGLIVNVDENVGKYSVRGGFWVLQNLTGDNFAIHSACGGGGWFCMEGVSVNNQMGSSKKLYIRGNSSSSPGMVRLINTHIPVTDYDIAAGSGTGGLNVFIQDNRQFVARRYTSSETFTPVNYDGTGLVSSFVRLNELALQSAPPTNEAILQLRDNGSGKSQLIIRFATGAEQVIATEP